MSEKKDIYLIINNVNGKQYVGQAKNTMDRMAKHISNSRHRCDTLVDRAIKKYGVENFTIQILEYQREDYNEKEKQWISKLDTLYPKGYNVAIGGKGNGSGIYNTSASIRSMEILLSIMNDIQNTNKPFKDIARKYKIKPHVITAINTGSEYILEDVEYPLRESRISDQKFKRIVYSLKYEHDKTLRQIAKEYNIDASVLSEINQGIAHRVDWLEYPVRSGKVFTPLYAHRDEIINLIKNTDMRFKDIAKRYNVSIGSIYSINSGLSHRVDSQEYPLRDITNEKLRKQFSEDEVNHIYDLLINSDKSMREIALEMNCCLPIILNMNKGGIIKFRKPEYSYPLRKKKKNKKS